MARGFIAGLDELLLYGLFRIDAEWDAFCVELFSGITFKYIILAYYGFLELLKLMLEFFLTAIFSFEDLERDFIYWLSKNY
jgi:hypothetical protein